MGNLRTNSIISDPAPFIPALNGAEKKKKPQLNDYEKVAVSSDYPQIIAYLDDRIAHYQQFMPGGGRIDGVKPAELPYRWGQATTIITELQALKTTFQTLRKSVNGSEETV